MCRARRTASSIENDIEHRERHRAPRTTSSIANSGAAFVDPHANRVHMLAVVSRTLDDGEVSPPFCLGTTLQYRIIVSLRMICAILRFIVGGEGTEDGLDDVA
jgi:hypothetical protein